jgi:ATP-dependent RNA helicase RhlE
MKFNELGLQEALLTATQNRGYEHATPIQREAIPKILRGRDILAGAQTGTGKTAAFALPILQQLVDLRDTSDREKLRVLVLTPTRELAAQVRTSFCDYGANLPFRSTAIYGGVNINPQKKDLKKGLSIVVATPGRLLDHLQQGTIDLDDLKTLVLDEADRMLDMGFIRDIKKILKLVPKRRQNLLFSATYSDEVRDLANQLLDNPVLIEVSPRNEPTENVRQSVYFIAKEDKRYLLARLIKNSNWYQVLVFARTKYGADRLAKQLSKMGVVAEAIHGNKSQNVRTRVLRRFKDGNLPVLVATDIAARGLDIESLPYVVNYELPNVPEDYVHRIGRTGRAGEKGEAISLVAPEDKKLLKNIEKMLKKSLHVMSLSIDSDLNGRQFHSARDKRVKSSQTTRVGQKRPFTKSRSGRKKKSEGTL